MEDKYKYYSYAILFISIIFHSIFLKNLGGYMLIAESLIFFFVFLSSTYIMYSLEKGESLEIYLMSLFAFSSINALILFLVIENAYPILLSILNLIGLYIVIFSIPQNEMPAKKVKTDLAENYFDSSYTSGKSDELKKGFEKSKIENTHYLPNEAQDIQDELLDEAEIVIEEIKPITDKEKDKKGKKNKPKK